jgi:hypothetical protein
MVGRTRGKFRHIHEFCRIRVTGRVKDLTERPVPLVCVQCLQTDKLIVNGSNVALVGEPMIRYSSLIALGHVQIDGRSL